MDNSLKTKEKPPKMGRKRHTPEQIIENKKLMANRSGRIDGPARREVLVLVPLEGH